MKRVKNFLVIICLFLSIMLIGKFSKAFDFEMIYLRTNKDCYYADESIEIEASWILDFIEGDDPFFQIQIFDNVNLLIWNSSEFNDKGLFEENWTVSIKNLNLNFDNYSNLILIRAFYSNEYEGGFPTTGFAETLSITIFKRNVSCRLSNFPSSIIFGNFLSFNARFYSEETNYSLSGKEIHFNIIVENSLIYQRNYTTNKYGIISINLSSIENMVLGINLLVFNISIGYLYNYTAFSYEVLVEKLPVYVDVLKYQKSIKLTEKIELELFYYYLNKSFLPLKNATVEIVMYDEFGINYRKIHITDNSGFLKINLSSPVSEINQVNYKFYLDIFYNGTEFLQESTLNLDFEISTATINDENTFVSLLIMIIGSFLSLTILINYIYQYKKRKPKYKKLNEIYFKF